MNLFLILWINLLTLINANIYNRCVNNKHITLTFDDGPHPNTINIVNILDKYNISGTFFINALNMIRENKFDLIKNMYNTGHIIASHGFSHGAMERLNNFNQLRELYDNELLFRQLFNKRPYFYRPPYFSYNDDVVKICDTFGYELITSNLNTNDWSAESSEEIYNTFINNFDDTVGLIVLQHDYQILGNEILEDIINYSLSKNYTFVPLDECLGVQKKYNDDNVYGPFLLNGI